MKKYIQPSIKVAIIKAPAILAGSMQMDKGEKSGDPSSFSSKGSVYNYGYDDEE